MLSAVIAVTLLVTLSDALVKEGQRYQPFLNFNTKTDDTYKVYGRTICERAASFASSKICGSSVNVTTTECKPVQYGQAAYIIKLDMRMTTGKSCEGVVIAVADPSKDQANGQMLLLSRGNCSDPDDYAFLKKLVISDPSQEYRLCQYVANVYAGMKEHESNGGDQRQEPDDPKEVPSHGDRFQEDQYHTKCAVKGDTVTLNMQIAQQICYGIIMKSQVAPEKHEIVHHGSCLTYERD